MSNADIDALLDADESNAPAWIPEEVGDRIVGTVVNLGSYDGGYGEYPIVVVTADLDGNEYAIHGQGSVLKDELNKKNPQIGDRIGVEYKGTPEGKQYKLYKVVVVRGGAA